MCPWDTDVFVLCKLHTELKQGEMFDTARDRKAAKHSQKRFLSFSSLKPM